jgi:aryl-alcohol dehydrogenase-like predicted oxidoreductase
MQYVRLGSSGLKVSRICLGMMSLRAGHQGQFTHFSPILLSYPFRTYGTSIR